MTTSMRWGLLPVVAMLAACASLPARHVYVLAPPTDTAPGVSSLRDRPEIVVMPVVIPDYLDSTDVVLRGGANEVTASATARWGERLSVGMTHALAADLQLRLPAVLIAPQGSFDDGARRILVRIESLDIAPDGHCALRARWTIVDAEAGGVLADARGNFAAGSAMTVMKPDDSAIVAAVSDSVGNLAAAIAASIRSLPTAR